MNYPSKNISLERGEFPPAAKQLFLKDFSRLADEYFESSSPAAIDFTRTDDGFSVCIIFQARRVKKVNAVI